MYFVKSKKNLEDQDAIEPMESKRRDRYQRSDSARLLLQAMPPQQSKSDQLQHQQLAADNGKVPYPKPVPADTFVAGSIADPVEFRPEELPDGACYRPKKDLKNLATAAKGNTVTDSDPKAVVASSPEMMSEQVRSAEYVGTFSVSGSDKAARERQMEQQLMQMRSSANSKPVRLCISSTGVKVILQENDNVFMDHSLKRIWYATCDPESCQFSFLAREPKTSAEVQYCHAFHTQSAEQAEELIAIIGQAFKSSSPAVEPEPPAAPPRQPTFHELIEQQVQQQQAKFREIEEEQKTALQEKLQQIATPTPLSKHAQHRMEQRRQSEDVEAGMGQGRLWAKDLVERRRVTHALSPDRNNSAASHRRSEIPTRQLTPQTSPFKRNSVPPQATVSPPVPSSPPPHPLSAMAIKEHLESKANGKFKGSPVTALKNEIDRRLAMTNGVDIPPPTLEEEKARLKQQHQALANRPLPLPPDSSQSPARSRGRQQQQQNGVGGQQQPQKQQQQQQKQQQQQQQQQANHSGGGGGHPPKLSQQRSLDDHFLPRSASSQVPLSSSSAVGAGREAANSRSPGGVRLRDSPRRHQPRPMSEIAVSSTGAAAGVGGGGGGVGGSYYEQQRQSLLNNFTASFNLPPQQEGGDNGMYIYGPSPTRSGGGNPLEEEAALYAEEHMHQQQQQRGRDPNRHGGRAEIGGHSQESSQGHRGRGQTRVLNSHHLSAHRSQSGDRNGGGVPRYQNDSPFQREPQEPSPRQSQRLESLMCLDRSHIHDDTLRETTWYQAGLPRDIAMEILQQEEVGSFLVRDSSTHPGCYVLSVRVPKYENPAEVSHYLILRTHRGVKLKGLDKEWSTLPALVTHHTVMREMLPCTLRLPKVKGTAKNAAAQSHGGEEAGGELGEDNYHQLAEVSGLVGKLKM